VLLFWIIAAHITEFAQLPGLRGFYAFGLDKRDYRNSKQTCAQQLAGAHLAVIRNQGEQDVIVNHILNAEYGLLSILLFLSSLVNGLFFK